MNKSNQEILAYSVEEFCKAHNIGRAFFFKLRREGKAPRIMKVGARTLISAESAAEWRKAMTETAAS